jgi:hypothetical protein
MKWKRIKQEKKKGLDEHSHRHSYEIKKRGGKWSYQRYMHDSRHTNRLNDNPAKKKKKRAEKKEKEKEKENENPLRTELQC